MSERVDAPTARVTEVVVVEFRRGKGVAPDDPVRMVTAFYSLKGELLAERDSWSPSGLVDAPFDHSETCRNRTIYDSGHARCQCVCHDSIG